MARIILHIGLRKTGTTSIQKFLNRNYEVLLDHNILYPRSGLPTKESIYAHHDLAVDITRIRPVTDPLCWEKLYKELSLHEYKLVFLSTEIFSVAGPVKIAETRKRLAGHEVIILLYLRNPLNFMTSLYKAQIKGHHEFRSFKNFYLKKPAITDFDNLVMKWQNEFGSSNVILKNYDDLAKGDLLLLNLLGSLGLEKFKDQFHFPEKANVSPSEDIVVMIRFLNLISKKLPLPLSVRHEIQAYISDLNKGNDRGKMLLERYSRFLPGKAIKENDLEWLEEKVNAVSQEYKDNFNNNKIFT